MIEFSNSPAEHLKRAEHYLSYGGRLIGGNLTNEAEPYAALAMAHIKLAEQMSIAKQVAGQRIWSER